MEEAARPVTRSSFLTCDPGEAHEFISQTYTAMQPVRPVRREGFRFVVRAVDAGVFRADTAEYGADCEAWCEASGDLLSVAVVQGTTHLSAGRQEAVLGPGALGLFPMAGQVHVTCHKARTRVFALPGDLLRRRAAEMSGIAEADFRLEALTPTSPVKAATWRRLMHYLHQEAAQPGSTLEEPLVRAQLAQMAATAILTAFPTTADTAPAPHGPTRVAPAALRRAMAYIEDHAHEPVTATGIAQAAGISLRALQVGFTRHFDLTPTAYLRRVRLEGAHRDLQAADPAGTTVAVIAARWGFAKPSHFTTYYKEHYNTLPSHTLRG